MDSQAGDIRHRGLRGMKAENDLLFEEHIRRAKREITDIDMHARDGKHDKLLRCLLKIRNSLDGAINRLLEIT